MPETVEGDLPLILPFLIEQMQGKWGGGVLKQATLCCNGAPINQRNGIFAFNLGNLEIRFLGLLLGWASNGQLSLKL